MNEVRGPYGLGKGKNVRNGWGGCGSACTSLSSTPSTPTPNQTCYVGKIPHNSYMWFMWD